MTQIDISEKIKRLRETRDLTQMQLSDIAGVSFQAVSQWENGKKSPGLDIECYDAVPDYIKCDFTLVCKGDSMINARIYDGDIVCIRKQPVVENGEIAAVLIDDEATLKRVYIYADKIILQPENPA